jgi:hypothetical protein
MNKVAILALASGFFFAHSIAAHAENFAGTTRYRSTKKVIRGSLCGRAARINIPPTLRVSLKDLRFNSEDIVGTLGTLNGVKMAGFGNDPADFNLSASAPIPSREGRCAVANTGGTFTRNSDGSLTVEAIQSVACNEAGATKRAYVCEDRKYRGRLIPRP